VTMFTFITVAFLEEVKGIEYLLKAFQLLTLKIQNQFELRIAGSGTLAKHLDNYAVSLGIKNQVHFTGYLTREGVRTNLQEAHVFVLPSIIEAFGVALIEAMSVGLPVIATRSGGPESLVTKDTGILVPVRDSKSLAKAMEKMYLHYKTYNRKTIRDHALNNFSPEAVYLQWHNLIKEVLDESDRV